MTDIKSMTLEELTAWLKERGEPAFRAKQIFHWLYRGVTSFDEMTDLSKALREKLSQEAFLTPPQVARKQVSKLDGTIKYLWELSDGNCVESVLMRYQHGNTVCISCQVGCRMGCAFCASTLAGKVRDLTPAEMIDQVLFGQRGPYLQHRAHGHRGAPGQLRHGDAVPHPGEPPGGNEHRHAPHLPVHLRTGRQN